MLRILTWTARLLFAFALAAAVIGFVKRDELKRLWTVNTIFEPERIVENFSHMDRAFLHTDLVEKGYSTALPRGSDMKKPQGFDDWIKNRQVTSVVVLHDGQVVHESYYLDTGPDDVRIGWSLSKSFVSTLVGIAIADGAIASIDDPVTKYAPELAGGAYARASIRNVLNMATGVTFDEDFTDYGSDINRMGRILALGGLMDDFALGLTENFAAPGSVWTYCSIDTHVLGMVIRGATGRSIAEMMRDRVLAPLAPEGRSYYLTDGAGVAFVLGGLNMTSRDFARFGQMVLQGGLWQDEQIVPRDWILASTTPSAPTAEDEMGYGYQWWMPRDARPREYMARGLYGQYLYINEPDNVVIVVTAADPDFRDRSVEDENVTMFRKIADDLGGQI